MKPSIGIADDHKLLRKGLIQLLRTLHYNPTIEADHGQDLIDQLEKVTAPDLVLMDINMPVMDGYETTDWLKKNKPEIRVVALSMYSDDLSIIKMIKAGARGYVLKDAEPADLKRTIDDVLENGFHFTKLVSGKLIHPGNAALIAPQDATESRLNQSELNYISLSCHEYTHKEIALKMGVSVRTVDGYRDRVFEKCGVNTRVGLMLYALKNKLISLE